jgi:hypothetical protein
MRASRVHAVAILPVLLGALGLGGCAKILGIEGTELAPGLDFACVGRVPRPQGDGSEVEIVAAIVDIATGVPLEGVRVVRCLTRLDLACESTEPVFSDADGLVRVPVTSGFNGYLRIEDPDDDTTDAGLVTYFWYFSEPIVETRAEPFPIYAMTRAFRRDVLYAQAGAPDPGLGEVAINATDCEDADAPGIHFEITTPARIGSSTVPFYFANGQIVVPSMPEGEVTDVSGLGGYLGVKPGSVGIRSLLVDTGDKVAEDTLLVQPDVLTTVRLLPQ